MSEELSDSILLTRAKMLNLKTDGVVFKPGVQVGVAEGDTIYKAKILSVDWVNTQVFVHFLNYNKRYDRAVNMSEIISWRNSSAKQNEYKRPRDQASAVGGISASVPTTSTPNGARPVFGESGHSGGSAVVSDGGMGSDVGGDSSANCSTCGCRVAHDYSLTCAACGKRFHAETVCVGISMKSIECILTEGGDAIRYFCCGCRLTKGVDIPSASSQECTNLNLGSFSQLLEMVGALAGQVRELVSKVSSIDSGRKSHETPGDSKLPSVIEKVEIGVQFHEREKRKSSVILRGCAANGAQDVQAIVTDICQVLNIDRVVLNSVVALKVKGLFRCRIDDDEKSRALLQNVKNLRNIDKYKSVFIDRDRTYQQRQQMRARWENARDTKPQAHRNGDLSLEVSAGVSASKGRRGRGAVGGGAGMGRGRPNDFLP